MTSTNNVFRPMYRELSETEKNRVDEIKNKAQELLELIDFPREREHPAGRHISLSKTALEESVMRAVKGITGPTA
jgi:hypothetical protein